MPVKYIHMQEICEHGSFLLRAHDLVISCESYLYANEQSYMRGKGVKNDGQTGRTTSGI